MNANVTIPRPIGIEAYHRERSRFIDAFAEIEEAISAHLMACGIKLGNDCLGNRIGLLQKAKTSAAYPAERLKTVLGLVNGIADLLDERNDLVHSRLTLATIGDEQKACFINVKQATCGSQIARLISFDCLRQMTQAVRRLAEQLRQA